MQNYPNESEKFKQNMLKIRACINSAMASRDIVKREIGKFVKENQRAAFEHFQAGHTRSANDLILNGLRSARSQGIRNCEE